MVGDWSTVGRGGKVVSSERKSGNVAGQEGSREGAVPLPEERRSSAESSKAARKGPEPSYRLWEEGDPRRMLKLRVKATLTPEGVKGKTTMLRADFMSRVLFEELHVSPKDLSCVVAFDNFRHWNITFWRREAYAAFWARYAEVADKEDLRGLHFEAGQKARERVLYLKMYTDDLEHADVRRWLEGRVEKILDIQRVLDQWQIWTGAWRARVLLDEDPRHPGGVRHLPSVVSIGPYRGYVTYHGQPKLCSRCGLAGHLAAFCSLTVCYRCGGRGHRAQACQEALKCTVCGGEGHLQRQCPRSYANKAREAYAAEERDQEKPEEAESTNPDVDTFLVEETPEAEQRHDVIEAADQLLESGGEEHMEEEQSEAAGEGAHESDSASMDLDLSGEKGKEPSPAKRKKKRRVKPMKKRLEEEGGTVQETEGTALERDKGKSGELLVEGREVEESGRADVYGYLSPTAIEHLARATGMRRVGEESSDPSSGTDV